MILCVDGEPDPRLIFHWDQRIQYFLPVQPPETAPDLGNVDGADTDDLRGHGDLEHTSPDVRDVGEAFATAPIPILSVAVGDP